MDGVSRHYLALLLSILFTFLGEDSYKEVFQKLRIFKTIIQIILSYLLSGPCVTNIWHEDCLLYLASMEGIITFMQFSLIPDRASESYMIQHFRQL